MQEEASAFQSLIDRIKSMEAELRLFKLAEFRQDLTLGIEQLDRDQSVGYSEDNFHELFDEIKIQGRSNLGQSA